jgi:hypothetical protein
MACLAAVGAAEVPSRVRLDVLEPAGRRTTIRDFPVAVGLVFPKGEVTALPGGRLVDDQERPVPFEAEATGWWEPSKENIKWLLLHFKASTDRHYFFEPGKAVVPMRGDVVARREGAELVIDTGSLQVRMDPAAGGLFKEVALRGTRMASSGSRDLILAVDDGANLVPIALGDWRLTLEESTPLRASVKASGLWKKSDGQPVARVDVRCEFFQGEAFVRLYHTLTWMTRDVKWGIRELSLAIVPGAGSIRTVQVGLGDEPATEAVAVSLDQGAPVEALQATGERCVVKTGERMLREGRTLDGWVACQGADGRGIALSLRHAWQRYPSAFRAEAGRLQVQLCPPSQRLSFEQEAIMGEGIYNHPCWKNVRRIFDGPADATHFYDNYSPQRGYLYTAEGAAFTHELLLSFHDGKTGRSPADLNSVTQQPLVVRQDPAHAMRVPFMGFTILPNDPVKHPEIERAVNQLGRISMGRWVGAQNFGLLRFGMVRWGQHERIEDRNANFYRWMDNCQYNQQLIPWLLYMRGGDRRFFDDAEIVSRYAMDMSVNHFNTRGSPTGYIAGCGSALPFPPFAFMAANMKLQKIHFLSYYHHLTGYRRAREVVEEVIAGTKAFTLQHEKTVRAKEPDMEFYNLSAGGREMYNMNIFWANAWEETWDPEIRRLADNGRKSTVLGQYRPHNNTFNGPHVYVFDGLVLQHRLSGDETTRDIMLRHLDIDSLTTHGGLTCASAPEDSIGFPWAFEQTKDPRFAEAAWDIARGMADIVPDIDFLGAKVPAYYPYEYKGTMLYRSHLMPILTGASLGAQLGYDWDRPHVFRDNFFRMWRRQGEKEFRAEIFIRARRAGDFTVRCLAKGSPKSALNLEVLRAGGSSAAKARIESKAGQPTPFQHDLTLKSARPGEVFKLVLGKADAAPVAVLGEAQVVHHLPADLLHAHEPLCSAQNFTPVRIVTRTTGTAMSYYNRVRRPYTLRDASTLELIFRGQRFTEAEAKHSAGAGRMILLTTSGCRLAAEWRMAGVEPFYAVSAEEWFQPYESGWR